MDPEALAQVLDNYAGQVWTALPGIVRSYSASTQLAQVQPAVQHAQEDADGERTDRTLPVIPDVPVCWMGGSGQYFHPGLDAGDEVLLVFSSLDPSVWQRTGSVTKAADLRRNHVAHAFAIPCVHSRGRALDDTGLVVDKAHVGPVPLTGLAGGAQVALAGMVFMFITQLKAAAAAAAAAPQTGTSVAALITAAEAAMVTALATPGAKLAAPPGVYGSTVLKVGS
jgi:hypothetical protein